VLLAYLTTRFLIFLVVYVSSIAIPPRAGLPPPHNLLLDGLTRWDGGYYLSIVTHGYTMAKGTAPGFTNVVFFPAYPLVVKVVTLLIRHVALAGVLVSNGALLLALAYLYALARREFDAGTAARAVLYLAAAPAAIFCAAVYSESLFVLAVSATFYYAGTRRWGRAALAGAAGAATRNTGVFLALVIALEGLHQQGVRFRPPAWRTGAVLRHLKEQMPRMGASWRSLAAAACVPVGLLAFMAYLAHDVGDPLAFVHGQRAWQQSYASEHIGHLPDVVGHVPIAGLLSGAGQHSGAILLNGLATLGFAPLVIAVMLKMRPAYAVYAALTFFVLLIFGNGVISMIRFVVMLVPCFLLLAYYGRWLWVDRLTLLVFLPLLAYLAVTFSHGYNPV
jgi:hypothetical protein